AINTMAVQTDGRLLVGGRFISIGGQSRLRLARLNSDGGIDSSFQNPAIDGEVFAITLQADGNILVGGNFDTVAGQPRNNVVRLHSNGSVDIDFVDPGATAEVYALTLQADGKLLVGGDFRNLGGVARDFFARVALTEPALQSLDMHGGMVIWKRSGISQELELPPTLSFSATGGNYTALGPMTRVAGGWQRSVSVPVGQFHYLRAEGRTGGGSGSQGLIRSVRQLWLDSDSVFTDGFDQGG
ncbi:MAG: delta-60 repeat domain-containing protein, partial [Dokdonella sp.]